MAKDFAPFWSVPFTTMLQQLDTGPEGLSRKEAKERLSRFGPNLLKAQKKSDALTLLLAQFKSPITLLLLFAAGLSLFLSDSTDAIIIFTIILISAFLGFWQEKGAADAVSKLLAVVRTSATVLRDGDPVEIPFEGVVPGDIVLLAAGGTIPGDCLVGECKDLFVDEAALTGETYPVEKSDGVIAPEAPLGRRTNALFLGTHVVSGSAKALVIRTGKDSEFGKVSERLKLRAPETEFERGVRRFGYLLLEITLILIIAIFAINVYLARPVLDSFLFSLALAVGLTPQLLPAIISINLAHGAKRMARQNVIVKRLSAIENFGSMNVLCTDKTGTLTEGVVRLHSAADVNRTESEKVFLYAYLNASFESGFLNPVDQAIRNHRHLDLSTHVKLDEVPYDFVRKRLSVLVSQGDSHLMVTKGAFRHVLEVCSFVETPGGTVVELDSWRQRIEQQFAAGSGEGLRMLGVAYRDLGRHHVITKNDETGMTFLGFIALFDPPKDGVLQILGHLQELGISMKVITGDNALVAANVAQQVGLLHPRMLTGANLRQMSPDSLIQQVAGVDVFAEVEPNQKERIILALKKAGNVVGYMGDGINDASALHAADVGLSVNTAVDVAKEAADIVLLEKDLKVLVQGVREGRTTFGNTLKYVFMATSANFGNMFSMAGASLFLPFLPLLPKQILLTNLMTDFPEMTIATDNVDSELVEKPRRWNIAFIRKFMITFGIVSSVFDYLTFGALLFILKATPVQFRTGWFMESVITAALIVLVIRTRKAFYKSRPGRLLLLATLTIVAVTVLFPFLPLARLLGFEPLPVSFLAILALILALYVLGAEAAKKAFYARVNF